jgi:DNA-binding MarR family transcriptional regulator
MSAAMVDEVRRFNRVVTQRAGALSDRFLERRRPLGEARMLWEIGTEGCEVRMLRSRLGLDSGHASRLLRALEDDGLVCVEPSAADGRVRIARLTVAGRDERVLLDERSDALAEAILDPLDAGERDELIAAMRTVRRLILASAIEIRRADPASAEARRCISAYYAELDRRSPTGFDPADGISAEPHEVTPPHGDFLLAYLNGEAVGCGAVRHHPGGPSHIKRMWVAESARGLGIARRLLAELEAVIVEAGVSVAQLETHRLLIEAIAMYRSAGYVEVEPFNDEPFADFWFEKRLV